MVNSKVLVEVKVPASGEKFDVFIPLTVRMGDVVRMVSGAVSDLSTGKYKAADDAILCDAETGIAYDVNTYVAELNIKNGSILMLV